MITKQLTGKGLMWTHYLQACTYAYNSFASPALNGLSPFSQLMVDTQNSVRNRI